jgi:hypothetical protein
MCYEFEREYYRQRAEEKRQAQPAAPAKPTEPERRPQQEDPVPV